MKFKKIIYSKYNSISLISIWISVLILMKFKNSFSPSILSVLGILTGVYILVYFITIFQSAWKQKNISRTGIHIFHLSLLIILSGSYISYTQRFTGMLLLTEGQSVHLKQQLFKTNRPSSKLVSQPVIIRLKDFKILTYPSGEIKNYKSRLFFHKQDGTLYQEELMVNQPAQMAGIRFLLHRYGVAPKFELHNKSRGKIFSSFINLDILNPLVNGKGKTDNFKIPATSLRIEVTVPDRKVSERLYVRIFQRSKLIREGILTKHRPLSISPDYYLTWSDLRYWNIYYVNRDPGRILIFSGLFLCLLGLLIGYYGKKGVRIYAACRSRFSLGRSVPLRV